MRCKRMKVFISHKNCDSAIAEYIAHFLAQCNVDCYLDLLDDITISGGRELTEHIRHELGDCTDIMVVLTENTILSWWVPFEIGIATEKGLPTVTYMPSFANVKTKIELPAYLSYWPCLRKTKDLAEYVLLRGNLGCAKYGSVFKRGETLDRFYADLKKRIS